MSPEIDELFQKALALPPEARAELANSLLESIDPTVDEEVDAAWQREIVRRMDEISSGEVKTIPWQEVRQKAREMLSRSSSHPMGGR
jgi:putative addiction module component (TIGR02574 family)